MAAANKHLKSGDLDIDASVPLIVLVENVLPRPKKPSKTFPRGDVDNYAKAPLDVITKKQGYWEDDNQIVLLVSAKRYAEPGEKAQTTIEIYQI